MAEIEPENVVQFVKQFMGRKDEFLFEYNGKAVRPRGDLGHHPQGPGREGAAEPRQSRSRTSSSPSRPTSTTPSGSRPATPGPWPGLNVLDIINEPIAAALSYGMQAGGQNKEETILVYDLGGGTFDVSVIQVGKDGVKILVTGGKNDLGGKNWDDRLITYLAAKFEEENGVNPLTDPFAHQELRTKGEIAKKYADIEREGAVHVRLRRVQVAASSSSARSSRRSPPTSST